MPLLLPAALVLGIGLPLSARDEGLSVTPTPGNPDVALAASTPTKMAGFALTGSVTFGSQYLFRGLSQTDGRPTIQGGLDLVHSSGFYFGTSLSNISWYTDQNAGLASNPTSLGSPGRVGPPLYDLHKVNSAPVELDLFGGFRWAMSQTWTLDLGAYRYLYPGQFENQGAYRNPSTTEAYLGLSRTWASLRYARVLSANTFGVNHSRGTGYLDFSMNIPLGEHGWSIQAHGGKATYLAKANLDYFRNGTQLTGDNALFSYSDFKLGVSKALNGYTISLFGTYANTRSRASDGDVTVYENAMGRNIGRGRVVLTVSKSF